MGKAANIISWEDVSRMLRHTELPQNRRRLWRQRLMILIGATTGLRHCDWGQLKWTDIMNHDSVTTVEKKTGKIRTWFLTPQLKTALLEAFEDSGHMIRSRHIFVNNNRQRNQAGKKPLQRAVVGLFLTRLAAEVGIEGNVSSHSLRKAFAMKIYKDVSAQSSPLDALFTVQSMFNHSSVNITMRYLGLRERANFMQANLQI